MVAAPVETPEERAARDADGPLKEFDWDAHLARIEADDEEARAAAAEEERLALAGGDEYLADDLDQLTPQPVVDDEPEFLKPRWDEVDPADVDFRNPPASRGATWSRIHIKSDWWQFEDGERLKTEEGWSGLIIGVPEPRVFEPRWSLRTGSWFGRGGGTDRPWTFCRAVLYWRRPMDVRIKRGPSGDSVGVGPRRGWLAGRVGDDALTFEARFVSDYLDRSSAALKTGGGGSLRLKLCLTGAPVAHGVEA